MKYFWMMVLVLYVAIATPIFLLWLWLSGEEIELYDTCGYWIGERCN